MPEYKFYETSLIKNYCKRFQLFFILSMVAFTYLWPAILNGYPLFHLGDSWALMKTAEGNLLTTPDRPITYILFLRIMGGFNGIWLSVFIQSFFTCLLVYRVTRLILGTVRHSWWVTLILIGLSTSLPIFVSNIKADLFTSWLCLGLFILLFERVFIWQCVAGVIVCFAAWSHAGNLALLPIFISLLVASYLLVHKSFKSIRRFKSLLIFVCFFCLSTMAVFLLNPEGLFTKNSPVYLTRQLLESDLLFKSLQDLCPTMPSKLCRYKDSLKGLSSREFLWDKEFAEQRKIIQ